MISRDIQIDALTLAERRAFMELSVAERREILANQARQMADIYETEPVPATREQWQAGDIVAD